MAAKSYTNVKLVVAAAVLGGVTFGAAVLGRTGLTDTPASQAVTDATQQGPISSKPAAPAQPSISVAPAAQSQSGSTSRPATTAPRARRSRAS